MRELMNERNRDFFSKQQEKDKKAIRIVKKNREDLIRQGIYPSKFRMPLGLQLELTSKCNLLCKHCYNSSGNTNSIDKMTTQDWEKLCNDIYKSVLKNSRYDLVLNN